MRKAYSYLRFSTPEQAKGDSHRRQSELARDYASRHDLDLDDRLTFHDLGVSAFRGANAAETGRLGQFKAAVEAGLVPAGSVLLVESLDRISRQAARRALRVLEDVVDAGVSVVTLTDGREYDREALDRDPTALLMALLIFIRANEESETKSRRLKASWAGKRAKATEKPITSRGPAWLRLEDGRWRVLEDRADVVRRIFSLALAGTGENSIATTLNRDGIATWGDNGRAPASMWHKSYVSKILTAPAVVGTLVPYVMSHESGQKTRTAGAPIPGYYPAIVSPETWAGVRIFKEVPNPLRGRHAVKPVQNVLGGLARCSACGSAMTRVYKGSAEKAGAPKLVCVAGKTGKGCSYAALPLDGVEDALKLGFHTLSNSGPNGDWLEGGKEAEDEIRLRIDEIDSIVEGIFQNASLRKNADAMKRLASLLEEKVESEAHIERIRNLGFSMAPESMQRSLNALEISLQSDPMDKSAVNIALRHLFSRVVVDVEAGSLALEWKSKEISTIPVVFQSTHERLSANAKRLLRTATGQYQGRLHREP